MLAYYGVTAIPAITTSWAGTVAAPASTIDLGAAAVASPNTLVAPTTGAALNQRIGRQIEVHKIKIHGHINVNAQAAEAAVDAPTPIRLVLVQDMQTNAGAMVGTDLFGPTCPSGSVMINCFQDPKNFGRFRVLKDKRLQVSDLNVAALAGPAIYDAGKVINFKMNVNFKQPVRIRFNATTTGTVTDVVDNSFHILAACVNTAYAPTLTYYCRVCYKDA